MHMRRSMFSLGLLVAAGILMTQFAAAEKAEVAAVGKAAPEFSLQDQTGKTVSLSEYKGKIVVLEWFNEECPFVVKFYDKGDMNKTAEKYAGQDVVWLAINSTSGKTNEANAAVAKKWDMKRPILNDSTGATGRAYGATNTPHMYIINKDGVLAYKGAIDSNKSSKQSDIAGSTNYVAQALDALVAGKSVSEPENKAYGCSVKYAKK
jgi:peroxiredoxin